jgi:phosphoesterase RecJ-like protein
VRSEIERLQNLLTSPGRVVILTHTRPDGDAIASLLSLCVSLDLVGYEVVGFLPEKIPQRYKFLPGSDQVTTLFPETADLLIAVDSADVMRLGFPSNMQVSKIDVNIDHHSSNSYFASINKILVLLGFPINIDVATLLLAGLVTDTIGFRTENVTPDVLRFAAKMQETGAHLAEIQMRALNEKSFAAVRYWGCGINRIAQKNDVVWTSLRLEDKEKSGYSGLDDADLVNLLSAIEGMRVAVILVEQPGGRVKVSWRSSSGINVSKMAERFGGGGHHAAAGAMIEGDLEKVTNDVLDVTFLMVK